MAIGNSDDFISRLRRLLPASWFPNGSQAAYPILAGVLAGFANVGSNIYSLLKYAKAQQRLGTTSDAFVDMAAMEFIGPRMPRRAGESDTAFIDRIAMEVVRFRDTRQAIITALTELTGRIPKLFEPWNTADMGALGYSIALGGGLFLGVGGCGSLDMPFTVFVIAYRPSEGSTLSVPDSEIFAMVDNVRAAGITAWVNIQN